VEQDPSELFGPAWERPHRYEAYPTLRTRMGLPALGGIPKVAVWALILLLAALLVFLFGPSLLGFGTDEGGGAGATATPAATEQATVEPEPTPLPAPTPQIHTVVKGDTMSKIAKKYGVTVEELMDANPQIKNPNKIAIGDAITIPVPVEEDASVGGDGTVDGESQEP
jgi:spore coat assembly protein SafA